MNQPETVRCGLAAFIAAGCLLVQTTFAQATITVAADQPGQAVSPRLWGIFFEDINLSADGGLYPELVRNRSFEDSDRPEYWTFITPPGGGGKAAIDSRQPLNPANPHSLRIQANGTFTLENAGYWGMNIVKGGVYRLTLAARTDAGFDTPLEVTLLTPTGKALAAGSIRGLSNQWAYHTLELTAAESDPKARLQLSSDGTGDLYLDMVSLMPETTWRGHGLRTDLGESLAALQPAFLRFPGGNWIEGNDQAHMYRWKTTLGPVDARQPLWNTWGYNTTQGLGYYEYLQLCEDLGAEPLFAVNCGMSLHDSVPLARMDQWVQDALDAIEYANGPTNTRWGAERARAGHPAPFHLRYMEIGNENGGPEYAERWALLANAIRAQAPEMQLIMTTDLRGRPYPSTPKPDFVDEHYYESPESFMNRADQYDHYDRHGPKIFVGEYAVTQNAGQGNLRAAVGEAAFMTGLERNADIVAMASYAPLFVNLNHRAWNPDLINFDSAHWYGIPSYYVQQMFAQNRGDVVLPVTVDAPPAEDGLRAGSIGVGTWRTAAEYRDIKVTAPDGRVLFASDFSQGTAGWRLTNGQWRAVDGSLRQDDLAENVRALAGDPSWQDYSLTLKARKISGSEGFLVLFRTGGGEDKRWWNLGGWGNSADAVEIGDKVMDRTAGQIETGRWYDLRLDVKGNHIQCWRDGKLIHDVDYQPLKSLFASATRDTRSGDLILKIVNGSAQPVATAVKLNGANHLSGAATATVLTSADPKDENTLEQPLKVSPQKVKLVFTGSAIQQTFPGNSVTVLRIPTH